MNADIVFVTGATGNVGRPLVDEVLARGAGVRALTRDPSGANLPPATEVVAADSADLDAFSGALEGATASLENGDFAAGVDAFSTSIAWRSSSVAARTDDTSSPFWRAASSAASLLAASITRKVSFPD